MLFFIYLSSINIVYCKDKPEYSISLIPESLKKNAKIVYRKKEIEVGVNKNSVIEKNNIVLSILNKNGEEYSVFNEVYNKFSSISNFKLTVYDGSGKKIKSFNMSDITDFSASSGYSLYEDFRIKYLDPLYKNFPCTFEYTYEKKLKSLMLFNNWYLQPDYNSAIENCTFTLNIDKDVKLNFVERNIQIKYQTQMKDEKRLFQWSFSNVPAIDKEDFEESFSERCPQVLFSPELFEIDNYQGSFKSWDSFAKWYITLLKDRDNLDSKTIEKIKQLTNGLSKKDKIAKVYWFMQQHCRYVSIQIGIGGWQPFDANTVDRLGYGDCKALTNYMYALLKCIGINSYHTLINAGKDGYSIIPNFPSNNFNHLILTVPLANDTLFLECTNQYCPMGHIGAFTDNRFALLVNDTGGYLIKTKKYLEEENTINTSAKVFLSSDPISKAEITMIYSGINFDYAKALSLRTNEDIKKNIYKNINIPNYWVTNFSFNIPDTTRPVINENINIDLEQYISKIGKKFLFPLNLVNKITELPEVSEQRSSDLVIKRYQTTIDSINYIIPDGFKVDKVPQPVVIEAEYGKYTSIATIKDNTIIYYRKLILNPGKYNASGAKELKDFYSKISIADNAKATILSN